MSPLVAIMDAPTSIIAGLVQPKLIHEFVTAYQQEYNRLRREQANEQAATQAELRKVERQIGNIVEAVKAALFATPMKDELAALKDRKVRLVDLARDQVEEPPMLHPGLAEVYRRKVEKLTEALNKEGLRAEATEMSSSGCWLLKPAPEIVKPIWSTPQSLAPWR